ncbi:unknown protein [Seminavis robusta]|uniref:Uncharacterized protein n=1 Tax=Seminavis robusta TaxID=568900 RepID=A0A9N8DI67_9STRA|nr:unknown protein [Seminavis robusta]|eukprot:Sro158_g071500.1 n/a (431) ;mRNA; r:26505-27797
MVPKRPRRRTKRSLFSLLLGLGFLWVVLQLGIFRQATVRFQLSQLYRHLLDHDTTGDYDRDDILERKASWRPQPIKFTTNETLSDYCQTNGSLHEIALQMAHFSGSEPYQKTLRILQASPYYFVYLHDRGIFDNVAENMNAMLSGWGLKPWPLDATKTFLLVEISFFARNSGFDYICRTTVNCSSPTVPRIIIQSEQLAQVGNDYLPYLKQCHELPLCVIWDFSDYHWQWHQQHNLSDSVLILPVMHQSLLGRYYDHAQQMIPLANRPLDVVFFGAMNPDRRAALLRQFQQAPQQLGTAPNRWKFEYNMNRSIIKESYTHAKVCLIVHSYANQSAGEYHRLQELAGSGCIPIVEQFTDTVGMRAYQECGGVVFAPNYEAIPTTLRHELLHRNTHHDEPSARQQQERRVLWWSQTIRWEQLLEDMYHHHHG